MFEAVSIRSYRRKLASFDSIPQFAILGIVSGLITGLVIVAFRKSVEWPLSLMLTGSEENFEALSKVAQFGLPLTGAVILAVLMRLINSPDRRVGVVHVLERLSRHQGHLPVKNLLVQFFAGTVALASGNTGGREGPAIHLGAASSSLIGQYLQLPNNSIRILVGCGAAAAISASFNTPIAGVIFSMEVIIMEYTIAGFLPVILSAVFAALIMQLFYGSAPAFNVPGVAMESFADLPLVLVLGLFIGGIAAVLVKSIEIFFRYAPSNVAIRMLIAGLTTGSIALAVPQIMGVGYDTVNAALLGDLSLLLLISIGVFKLIATAVTIAMGVPVGVIGPTLVIGAVSGGILWVATETFFPSLSSPAFYVMLGMGAMMGAVLQAPLAALMAVVELTQNPSIILPAMLVIVIANITAGHVFGVRSVFITQMQQLGLEFRQNPLSMALNRASVASIMSRSFERVESKLSYEDAKSVVAAAPTWLLVNFDNKPRFILRTEDLSIFLSGHDADVDLSEIPATRKDVTSILLQATLSEALDTLNASGVQALFVNRITAPMLDSPVGIVTREDIESYYQK